MGVYRCFPFSGVLSAEGVCSVFIHLHNSHSGGIIPANTFSSGFRGLCHSPKASSCFLPNCQQFIHRAHNCSAFFTPWVKQGINQRSTTCNTRGKRTCCDRQSRFFFASNSTCENVVTLTSAVEEPKNLLADEGTEDSRAYKEGLLHADLSKVPGTEVATDGVMALIFTCKRCNTRTAKKFSKTAYDKGIVIIRCPGCKNLHLIADRLKWFGDEETSIETILKEKGEVLRRLSAAHLLEVDDAVSGINDPN